MARHYDQYCPVARTLDLLGDRWTLLIVRDLFLGRTRFSEFQESLEGIPSNVLSERLKLLEASGIVERTLYNDHPPRAEYSLTPKGKDLHWVLDALTFWGSKYIFNSQDFQQLHAECDHPVKLAWLCTDCEQTVRPSAVKIKRKAKTSEG